MQIKEEKSPKAKKILTTIINVTSVALIIFLVVLIGLVIGQKVKGEQTNIFGYTITKILSPSMAGDREDSFDTDDVILCKMYAGQNLEKDEIITFYAPEGHRLEGYTITHRIYDKKVGENGDILYTTKGDANSKVDEFSVTEDMIIAIYVARLPVLTWFFKIIGEFWGFLLIIVMPLVLILIVQIVKLVKLKLQKDEPKSDEEKVTFTEEEIKQFIKEKEEDKTSPPDA